MARTNPRRSSKTHALEKIVLIAAESDARETKLRPSLRPKKKQAKG